jgi:hypothetical protein
MTWWQWLLRHVSQETGISNSASRAYNAWSGFLGAGIISSSIVTNTWHHYRAVNCPGRRCWRIGRHPYIDQQGVEHRYCRHCHPVLKGKRLTRAQIHAAHDEPARLYGPAPDTGRGF